MKKIMLLVLPVVFSVFLMSSAMAMIKPYRWDRIKAEAFDFYPWTIELLNDIDLSNTYLEYGRATAYVTRTDLQPPPGPGLERYEGSLKFAASGVEGGYPFSVALFSEGPLDCSVAFSGVNEELTCSADDGQMRVRRRFGFSYIVELIDLKSVTFTVNTDDTITVTAYDSGGPVIDATGELTVFRYWGPRCWGLDPWNCMPL